MHWDYISFILNFCLPAVHLDPKITTFWFVIISIMVKCLHSTERVCSSLGHMDKVFFSF